MRKNSDVKLFKAITLPLNLLNSAFKLKSKNQCNHLVKNTFLSINMKRNILIVDNQTLKKVSLFIHIHEGRINTTPLRMCVAKLSTQDGCKGKHVIVY